jgi:hypothetical protein
MSPGFNSRIRWRALAAVSIALLTGCDLFTPVDPCMHQVCAVLLDAAPSATAEDAATTTDQDASLAPDSAAVSPSASSKPSNPLDAETVTSTDADAADAGRDADTDADAASDANASDTGVTCLATCSEPTPLCDPTTGQCVACLGVGATAVTADASLSASDAAAFTPDPGCTASAPRCYRGSANQNSAAAEAACVACLTDTDCHGNTGVCDPESHTCVECATSTDCPDPSAARCDSDTRTCTACDAAESSQGVNPDCTHLSGADVCHAGTCVECDADFQGACDGTALESAVCDLRPGVATEFSCASGAAPNTAYVCDECINDAQCQAGEACVLTSFGSGDDEVAVGWFCLLRVDPELDESESTWPPDEDLGVPRCGLAKPHLRQLATFSTPGAGGSFCAPQAATCVALKQYNNTRCQAPASGTDAGNLDAGVEVAECGAVGADDAVCQYSESFDDWRCAPRCLTDNDCVMTSGSTSVQRTCDDGVCSFN